MPEKVSAGGLLNSLKETFGLGKKKPEGVQAVVTPPVAPATLSSPEMPVARSAGPALEPAPAMAPPEAAATEAPALAVETVATSEPEIPDWLRGEQGEAAAPLPEPEAPVAGISAVVVEEPPVLVAEAPTVLPAAETPMPPVEARVEADPFAVNKEFNGYMETIRQAQAVLASGTALNPEEQRKALIAVARSNSLLSKLPRYVLESVLLMRAVAANNPNFGRDNFQMEMLAAMDIIKTGAGVKG